MLQEGNHPRSFIWALWGNTRLIQIQFSVAVINVSEQNLISITTVLCYIVCAWYRLTRGPVYQNILNEKLAIVSYETRIAANLYEFPFVRESDAVVPSWLFICHRTVGIFDQPCPGRVSYGDWLCSEYAWRQCNLRAGWVSAKSGVPSHYATSLSSFNRP